MKTFKCNDGTSRVFSKHETTFSSYELAVFNLTDEVGFSISDDMVVRNTIAKLKKKKDVMNGAWEIVLRDGKETPHYRVGDNYEDGGDKIIGLVITHIKTLFPELD